MIAEAARRLDESVAKKQMGVEHWINDANWQEALEMLMDEKETEEFRIGERYGDEPWRGYQREQQQAAP